MKTYVLLDKDNDYNPVALLRTNRASRDEIQEAIENTWAIDGYTATDLEDNLPSGVAIEWLTYDDPLIW